MSHSRHSPYDVIGNPLGDFTAIVPQADDSGYALRKRWGKLILKDHDSPRRIHIGNGSL